jgi:hypothetical protein
MVGFDPNQNKLSQKELIYIGTATSIISRFATQPLDVVKIRFQASNFIQTLYSKFLYLILKKFSFNMKPSQKNPHAPNTLVYYRHLKLYSRKKDYLDYGRYFEMIKFIYKKNICK